jgi:hypothetical protein
VELVNVGGELAGLFVVGGLTLDVALLQMADLLHQCVELPLEGCLTILTDAHQVLVALLHTVHLHSQRLLPIRTQFLHLRQLLLQTSVLLLQHLHLVDKTFDA